MPKYEFECNKCNNTFFEIVKMNSLTTLCPNCKETAIKTNNIHNTTFKLNGQGWYQPGYPKEG